MGVAAVLLMLVLVGLAVAPGSVAAAAGDGEAVFRDAKCGLCHAVPAVGIEAKTKNAKLKGPALGPMETPWEGEWLRGYLKQEETLDGEEHRKPFKGSEEELQVLVDWLLELASSP